eukprot:TRINITY_DN79304_c0_g1_i1.p1 TRINITY_DN79304_c0_g1~~TRINITY_DN79304_c0_g1_i1.p1  ORF type:complete len:470 (+),score=74.81 TRINITY_DN79304_c0_g1_i1:97-1506(+)
MMHLFRFAVLAAFFLSSSKVLADELSADLLKDDECGPAGTDCALNALQLTGNKRTTEDEDSAGDDDFEDDEANHTGNCNDCMTNNGQGIDSEVLGSGPRIRHYAWNCWTHCGRKGGFCENFCGAGNACCRYGFPGPPECKGIGFWPVYSFHTCVIASLPSSTATETGTDATSPVAKEDQSGFGKPPDKRHSFYLPKLSSLAAPSESPLLSFYIYRAMGDSTYPPENINAANAAGVLWYLHNEVVFHRPRKFKITRIVRIKVQYRAPTPLHDIGMNFGVRYAFDSGKCTGPGDCDKQFEQYGFFVGCNHVNEYPTPQFADAKYYPNATWYSFPGPCNDKDFKHHSTSCIRNNPGGACSGVPTGKGDCTYSYEPAGEISVNDMVGIKNYAAFLRAGGHEYIRCRRYSPRWPTYCDKGIHARFWNWKHSKSLNEWRVNHMLQMFADKYPGTPRLPDVPCDFKKWDFEHGMRR